MSKQAWLKREVEQAAADVKKWPAWMRSDAGSREKPSTYPRPPKKVRKLHVRSR